MSLNGELNIFDPRTSDKPVRVLVVRFVFCCFVSAVQTDFTFRRLRKLLQLLYRSAPTHLLVVVQTEAYSRSIQRQNMWRDRAIATWSPALLLLPRPARSTALVMMTMSGRLIATVGDSRKLVILVPDQELLMIVILGKQQRN